MGQYASGDWGGYRTELASQGYTLFAYYNAIVAKLIFGATYGRLSQDYADQQQALGNGRPTYEMPLELGYRVQLNRFAYIQPDVQYVIRPGGTGNIPNATVLGAQFGASF